VCVLISSHCSHHLIFSCVIDMHACRGTSTMARRW
jgi:hypothetical protein